MEKRLKSNYQVGATAVRLTADFFTRNTKEVAKDLLGKKLVRKIGSRKIEGIITETEVYRGWHDKACHASGGKTKRNEPMFGPAGSIYVYLIYGMYNCLNLVTEREGYPAAVLIRGVEGISGPGRLCKHFKIDRSFSGCTLGSDIWVEDVDFKIKAGAISNLPRVGIDYAGPSKNWKWRFLLQ